MATLQRDPGAAYSLGEGWQYPSNVSSMVRGAELRIAEARGVNRALRKAYGIRVCSVEELERSQVHSSPPPARRRGTELTPPTVRVMANLDSGISSAF
jgi:hypothetical protein